MSLFAFISFLYGSLRAAAARRVHDHRATFVIQPASQPALEVDSARLAAASRAPNNNNNNITPSPCSLQLHC